jgi:hypothetical protein
MMFSGEEPKIGSCPKKERDALLKLGLVEIQHRGRVSHLALTDLAWERGTEIMSAELADARQRDLGQCLLASVLAFVQANDVALADFVRPSQARTEDLPERIRAICLSSTGGRYTQRVRLADVRDALPGVESVDVQRAVMRLVDDGVANLLSLDDPLERQPRDDAAAIWVGGKARHLLYLDRP